MKRSFFAFLSFMVLFAAAASAQNRFDGYSLTVSADSTGACPIRFLPNQNQLNHIQVFFAGTACAPAPVYRLQQQPGTVTALLRAPGAEMVLQGRRTI